MKHPDRVFGGDYSRDMWKAINKAKTKTGLRNALYLVCCRLQELEAKIADGDYRGICACCGNDVLEDGNGSFEICPICGWEDDPLQNEHENVRGGANRDSLAGHRAEFAEK
jgi:hypothetical protein